MNIDDEIGKLKADVMTVFHRVSTYLPRVGNVSGCLIVAKNEDELIFWWSDYPEAKSFIPSNKDSKAKFAII